VSRKRRGGAAQINPVKLPRFGSLLQISISSENAASERRKTRFGIF
jgi:hypothetical protein